MTDVQHRRAESPEASISGEFGDYASCATTKDDSERQEEQSMRRTRRKEDDKDRQEGEVELNSHVETKVQMEETAGTKSKSDSPRSTVFERGSAENPPQPRQKIVDEAASAAIHDLADSKPGSRKKKSDLSSKTEAFGLEARKLKTATLGRMGKMFKSRPPAAATDKTDVSANRTTDASDNYGEQPSRKEKTNSLGRMLKLVDKDGVPKYSLHSRAGSLSRILRRNPANEDSAVNKSAEDPPSGIFAKMLNQLRGRSTNENSSAEPNVHKKQSLPPKPPSNSRFTSNVSRSSSSRQRQSEVSADYSV